MALIDIDYGSLASSETLNKNFQFLQNSISDFAQVIETNKASLESQISTVNTNITNKLDSNVAELKLPTGTILPMLQSVAKLNGFLLCDGSAISRTTYSALFSIIKETYGKGDGSTSFNIPNLKNRVVQGAPSATNFGYISAGLPNLIGSFTTANGVSWGGGNFGWSADGKFYNMGEQGGHNVGNGGSRCSWRRIGFDASANNDAIYGKSSTVQPPAMKVNFYIKY